MKCVGFSWWLLLLQSASYGCMASVVAVHRLSCLRHAKSFQTRDRTYIPCVGRQILNHWTTREVQFYSTFDRFLQPPKLMPLNSASIFFKASDSMSPSEILQCITTVCRIYSGSSVAHKGFSGGAVVKNPPANAGYAGDTGIFLSWEDSLSRKGTLR